MPPVLIPKYSMTGPFKGQRSMKSSPLFPGSSCSLSTQFLIQDHMSTHYQKLNSAKAAVDTSAPRSLSSSIKYRDQQNKERLLKAIEKFMKELQQICPTSHHHSPSNFPEQDKVYYGHRKPQGDKTEKRFEGQKTRPQTYDPVLIAREVMDRIGKELHDVNLRSSVNHNLHRKKPYNDPQKQTYSGDLLDKHPKNFTNTNKPFKPRLVKKPSKSFLSKYRYYMAPKKKSTSSVQDSHQDEAKLYSYLYGNKVNQAPPPVHLQAKVQVDQPPKDKFNVNLIDENKSARHLMHLYSSGRRDQDFSALYEQNKVDRTREEDVKYLRFLEDLTNDIVLRGCRSNSAMERVFQDHLQRKHPDIDESKKKILVEELRRELERSVKLDFSISYDGTQYGSGDLPRWGNLNRLLKAQ
ncbi:spermatogenesis-associated protein 7 homolog [Leptodactylus fuscus]